MTIHLEKLKESKSDISSHLGALQMIFDHQSNDDFISIEFMGVSLNFDFRNDEFYIEQEQG